jgi:hypothetical protein
MTEKKVHEGRRRRFGMMEREAYFGDGEGANQ